jgi:hypothetical protein
MTLLLQDIVVTSITVAVVIGAVVRVVKWMRPSGTPACPKCNACGNSARPSGK